MATQPFYVSPEQLMADRAEFARKGISRGRSVIVAQYRDGIAFFTENPSRALHKFSEIYDRIGFAAVGKYNEFENLRVAGIRYADMRGYTYDRTDVTARGLANAYAQTLGTAFTNESKPLEVELVVAEVGDAATDDLIYRLTFDGSVAEERNFVVMGGNASLLTDQMSQLWRPELSLNEVLKTMALALQSRSTAERPILDQQRGSASVDSLPVHGGKGALTETFDGASIEAAVLDRTRKRRKFKRLDRQTINTALGE